MKKLIYGLVILLALMLVAGCGTTDTETKDDKVEYTKEDLVGSWEVQTNENGVNEPQTSSIYLMFGEDGAYIEESETDIEGVEATTARYEGTYTATEDTISVEVESMTVDDMTIVGADIPEDERTIEYTYSIKEAPSDEYDLELTLKNTATELEGIYFKVE